MNNHPIRIPYLLLLLAFSILICSIPMASGAPSVGAIRWDAWSDDHQINAQVEASLGPDHFHYRIPFFGQVTGKDSVSIRGNSQAIMDQEIAYAANAGINYWDFVIYSNQDGLSNALHLYLASTSKSRIHFCINLQGGMMASFPDWSQEIARYVGYFKDPQYQTVLNGRPLVYLLQPKTMIGPKYPDWAAVHSALDALRQASVAAGTGNPYIVIQGHSAQQNDYELKETGSDAMGAYGFIADGSATGSPFSELAQKTHALWEAGLKTGSQVVPMVTAGWDKRTRTEHPTSWDKGGLLYYQMPTPAELASHLADALEWTRANQKVATPADTVLIYAWNEHDEGGWICPTLNLETNSPDTHRLDAIAAVIHSQTPKKTESK